MNTQTDKKPNETSSTNMNTPKAKGDQSIQSSGSKVSSRGMSINLNIDHLGELEKYDKFTINVRRLYNYLIRILLTILMIFMILNTLTQMRLKQF